LAQVWYVMERGIPAAERRVFQAGTRGSGRAAGGSRVVDGLAWCFGVGPAQRDPAYRHKRRARLALALRAGPQATGAWAWARRAWERADRVDGLCVAVMATDAALVGQTVISLSAVLALAVQAAVPAAPLLMTTHLFDVLNQSPVLRNVIRSGPASRRAPAGLRGAVC
jgi:hypothetical protein